MNAKESRLQECKDGLLQILKPGDTVYTVIRHVSRSGMYRVISLYVMRDNQPRCIDYLAADLLEGYDRNHDGCKAGGCGMDMGFHLVYTLSSILFRGGFICIGNGCGANDHANSPYPDRIAGSMIHKDSGYALHQRWM